MIFSIASGYIPENQGMEDTQNDGPWKKGALLWLKIWPFFAINSLDFWGVCLHDVCLYFHDGRQMTFVNDFES